MIPHPRELTSHQQPALLVDELESAHADGASGTTRLRPGTWDLLQLTEGCAQSIAVVMGFVSRQAGSGERARGMLVGVKDACLLADAPSAERIAVRITRLLELAPFAIYQTEARAEDGTLVMRAELKIMALPSQEEAR